MQQLNHKEWLLQTINNYAAARGSELQNLIDIYTLPHFKPVTPKASYSYTYVTYHIFYAVYVHKKYGYIYQQLNYRKAQD